MKQMKKNKTHKLTEDGYRILLIVLAGIFSTAVLLFSTFALTELQEGHIEAASRYIFFIFLVLGLSRLVTCLRLKTRISFIRFIVLLLFDIALGVIGYFGKDQPYFYSLCGGLFCLTIIASRVFYMIQKHTVRDVVLNIIVIGLFVFLAVGLFTPYEEEELYTPIILTCFIVILTALIEVLSNAFQQMRFKTLFRIVIKTFALEIILGLFTMVVASALVYQYFEPDMNSFGDGLWYAFAVVTTIGFGDINAVTPVGRAVTVFLGIYGIVVVAVITSIVVNFYNETVGKKDAKEMREIKKDVENDMKKERNKR